MKEIGNLQAPQIFMHSSLDVCHYSRYTFFDFDMQKGEVNDYHQQRNLIVGEDFIVSLLKGLEHEVGESAGLLLYMIGENWGKQDAIAFEGWFKQYYNLTLETSNLAFAMETWWWPLTAQGWGTWSLNLSSLKEGFIFVDLFDSAVAKTLGYVGKPVCHLYAGLLSGFFSVVFAKGLSSTEIQCYAMGNEFCRFLIGSEKRIRATEFWLSSGATASEVANRFMAEEIPAENDLLVRD
ncbi:4-vinyl reductase 4VR domain-containing protein [Tumidithrix helvetica PCC 7403]|uniref:V4R domain-containing protein n=1 Tax=Tumidithrix helvetica TaxID=3457545 RepID=UPI003CC2AF57